MSSNKNDLEITRIAVGRTAFLGSLYDLREDSIPDKLSLGDTKINKISDENPSKCEIIRSSQCDHQHLLSMIGISNDLWLNVTLNIVSSQGMLSLANYSLPTDTNIRILHYYDLCEKQTIPFELSAIKPNIPKILPEVKATHIVSGIKFGIQILLVLRLSPNDETRLDSLLEKLQERFLEKKFDLKTDELSLLNRMKLVKVFSNVPDLIRMNSLADVCTFMGLKGSQFRTNSRLEYNLRPINWFYSDYPSDKSKCVQLELSSHKIIKEHLIKLSTQFAESQQSNGSEMRPSGAQNSRIQISSEECERIREIILNIRQGKLEQRKAIQMLADEFEELNSGGSSSPNSEWETIEDIQSKIKRIIRPLLETMRNLLRNIILSKRNSKSPLIKLHPEIVTQTSSICYTCPRTSQQVVNIWILLDNLHIISDKCTMCSCNMKEHIPVDYKLTYEIIHDKNGDPSFINMEQNVVELKAIILHLAQFFASVLSGSKENDPLLSALKRMAAEEGQICSEESSRKFNLNLHRLLLKLIEEYEEKQSTSFGGPVDFEKISNLIEKINDVDDIRKQIQISLKK